MAIIYMDRLDTTLVEPLDASSTQMVVSPEVGAAIRAAFGWSPYTGEYRESVYGPKLIRLPLYIDNGVAVERIEATVATDSGVVTIVRGTPSYAFGAGTAVRCAPPAGHIAEGFAAVRDVTGTTALAVPGETVAWAAGANEVQLSIYKDRHAGDCWPARVVIGFGSAIAMARTIQLMDIDLLYPTDVYVEGLSADGYSVSSVSLPEACKVAVLTIYGTPYAAREVFGVPTHTMTVEVFG